MSKQKAFWISFGLTMAVLAPLYFGTALYGAARSSATPADTAQSGVWIAQPTAQDKKTLLLLTGAGTAREANACVLLRFDALQNAVTVAALPMQTVVLVEGSPQTLAQALESAGPSQAVAALEETLEISIDHYLFAAQDSLSGIAAPLGTIQLRLGQFLEPSVLSALQLNVSGTETQTLTAQMLEDILTDSEVPAGVACKLRAQGYAELLRVGSGLLADTLAPAIRKNSAKLATNLTATDLYAYERIFSFLDREEPIFTARVLDGTYTQDRYELAESAVEFAAAYLGKSTSEPARNGTASTESGQDAPQEAADASDAESTAAPKA